jgi:hypothetical protein
MEEYAIVQAMHHAVRDFFRRPHYAVFRSPFRAVASVRQARILMMIQTACVRYLSLHYQEVMGELQHLDGDWGNICTSPDNCGLVSGPMQYSTPKWLDYFQLNREGPSSNSLTPRLQSIVSIGPGIDQFEPESSRSSPSQSELAAGLDRTGPYLQLRPSGPVNTLDINSASHKPKDIQNFIRYLKSRPLIKYSLDYLTQRKATLIQIALSYFWT